MDQVSLVWYQNCCVSFNCLNKSSFIYLSYSKEITPVESPALLPGDSFDSKRFLYSCRPDARNLDAPCVSTIFMFEVDGSLSLYKGVSPENKGDLIWSSKRLIQNEGVQKQLKRLQKSFNWIKRKVSQGDIVFNCSLLSVDQRHNLTRLDTLYSNEPFTFSRTSLTRRLKRQRQADTTRSWPLRGS